MALGDKMIETATFDSWRVTRTKDLVQMDIILSNTLYRQFFQKQSIEAAEGFAERLRERVEDSGLKVGGTYVIETMESFPTDVLLGVGTLPVDNLRWSVR